MPKIKICQKNVKLCDIMNMVEGDYMLGDINNYKDKLNNILTNKQYSKKTPLNTYTSQLLINKFKFNPHRTYITINTLQKEHKDAILFVFPLNISCK